MKFFFYVLDDDDAFSLAIFLGLAGDLELYVVGDWANKSLYKVMEGVPDMLPTFCFSEKERQLVQVVVSPYTYPTFMLSVAAVLLVVSC